MNLTYNTLVVLVGSALLGAGAGVIGSFAVLRRRALTGDALAHAALPGLCLAFIILGQRNLPAMLAGALCTGVAGVAIISGLRRWTRIKEDAAIGIVLGVFFGAGIALSRLIQNLSTTGSKAGIDSYILGKTAGMTRGDVYLIAGMALASIGLVMLLYKEFKLTVFDPGFAQAQGWPVVRLDLLLMSLVAVAVVIGLPAVGVVLIAALLILPGAAARFWTDRLGRMLWLSALFGTFVGIAGTLFSAQYERLPTGPIIVLVAAGLFLVSLLFGPSRGIVAVAIRQLRFRRDLAAGTLQVDEPEPGGSVDDVTTDLLDVSPVVDAPASAPASRPLRGAPESSTVAHPRMPLETDSAGHWSRLVLGVGLAAAFAAITWLWWQALEPANRSLAAWTIAIGCLVNVSCAILGCYLVLRRMSLLGDAISHSVLPGIALGFLLTGQVTGLPIVVGALALGMLTALLTDTLHTFGRVPEDSSMGVVYTTLFAVGVVLITRFATHAHLDDCLLYGAIENAALDTQQIGSFEVPRALPTLLVTFAGVLAFVGLLWKELRIASFDAQLATAMGLSAVVVHYLLMGVVAGVTVASFEAVGSILVVAMLIVPAATAQLLADRLAPMLAWATASAVVSAVGGYAIAERINTSTAGMMAVVAGAQFAVAVFFAPRYGLVSRWWRNFALSLRIAAEDVIGLLFRAEEAAQRGDRPVAVATLEEARTVTHGLARLLAIPHLRRRGEIRPTAAGALELTDFGREHARSIVRSHRLWETYLGEETELPLDHLHEPAERMEHFIGRELQEQIAAKLSAVDTDPHGRKIPPETRETTPDPK